MIDTPFALRKALEALIPYAASRVQDMHANAEETHGEGKAYRCACYRRAQSKMADAYQVLGMTREHEAEATWGAQMRRAVATDCGHPRGSCSYDGACCVAPADDMAAILSIPGAVEALAAAGAS